MPTTVPPPSTNATLEFALLQDDLHLSIEREPARRLRATVTSRMQQRLDRLIALGDLTAGCVFTGTKGRNVALLGQLGAREDLAADSARRFTLEVVDHIAGAETMLIDPASPMFHFINVFQVAPGRRDQMVDYFVHTIPAVRAQPGYIATNLLMNADGTRAVNIGQYDTREDFLAIFRQREVIAAFREGPSYKVMPTIAGLFPHLPRLRLYGTPTPVQGQAAARSE